MNRAHAAYVALGFEGSPVSDNGVARPAGKAYFTSRGACMGQVTGEIVAAGFAVFNPLAVVRAVEAGWQITSREAILAARAGAATAMLQWVLGKQPEGLGRVTDMTDQSLLALDVFIQSDWDAISREAGPPCGSVT